MKDKALSAEEAADLVKALMDEQSDMVKAKQHLVDKLYEAKVREIRKNEVLAAEKIKELNSQKAVLREKEKKVLEDKAVFEQLRGRGVEFLKEIELGNAPPIEAIKKNFVIDIKAVQVRKPGLAQQKLICQKKRTKQEVIELSEKYAKFGDARLDEMKKRFNEDRKKHGLDES